MPQNNNRSRVQSEFGLPRNGRANRARPSRQSTTVANSYANARGPARRSVGSTRPRGSDGASMPTKYYSPTSAGEKAGQSIGTLEAEFFGAMLLVALTIFFDPKASSDYSSVMLAAMKRATMVIITFFLLALLSAAGPNAARAAKAFGALIIVALILAQAQQGVIDKLDSFFKSDWTSGGGGSDSSANAAAGTQTSGITAQDIENALGDIGKSVAEGIPGAAAQVVTGAGASIGDQIKKNPAGIAKSIAGFISGLVSHTGI